MSRLRPALVGAVAVVAAALIAVLATREPALNRVADSPLIDQPAPAVAGRTFDGQTYDLAGEQGRWVVVNFFASWCVPCRVEHPELLAFAAEHAETGDADVVSVIFDDEPADVRRFFADNGGSWPVLIDPDGRISLDYGVTGVPESYLVDPAGVVRAKITGGVTRQGLNQTITELVSGAR